MASLPSDFPLSLRPPLALRLYRTETPWSAENSFSTSAVAITAAWCWKRGEFCGFFSSSSGKARGRCWKGHSCHMKAVSRGHKLAQTHAPSRSSGPTSKCVHLHSIWAFQVFEGWRVKKKPQKTENSIPEVDAQAMRVSKMIRRLSKSKRKRHTCGVFKMWDLTNGDTTASLVESMLNSALYALIACPTCCLLHPDEVICCGNQPRL